MKSDHYKRVESFMRQCRGQEVHAEPTVPSLETRLLRARLLLEEVLETVDALGALVYAESPVGFVPVTKKNYRVVSDMRDNVNLVDIADGCADVAVIATGTLISCGIHDVELQAEVDESNLAKFKPGHSYRADGKLLKPKDWTPPDIERVIREQKSDA